MLKKCWIEMKTTNEDFLSCNYVTVSGRERRVQLLCKQNIRGERGESVMGNRSLLSLFPFWPIDEKLFKKIKKEEI